MLISLCSDAWGYGLYRGYPPGPRASPFLWATGLGANGVT
jgi:hypothetical protein